MTIWIKTDGAHWRLRSLKIHWRSQLSNQQQNNFINEKLLPVRARQSSLRVAHKAAVSQRAVLSVCSPALLSRQLEENAVQRDMCIVWMKQMQAVKEIKQIRVIDTNNITKTPRNYYLVFHNDSKCHHPCDMHTYTHKSLGSLQCLKQARQLLKKSQTHMYP